MKKNLLLLAIILPVACFCQKDTIPKNADGKYEYTEVVNVDSSDAASLYSKAKMFIVSAFKSGKDVTQLNDDNSKTVIGKGVTPVSIKIIIGPPVSSYVGFTISIQCKNNRYRYLINDFILDDISTKRRLDDTYWQKSRSRKKMLDQIQHQIYEDMTAFVTELKKDMSSHTAKDW